VTFSFSVFDIISHSIPGSLALLLALRVGSRLHWLSLESFSSTNSLFIAALWIGLSLLVGNLLHPLAVQLEHLLPRLFRRAPLARRVLALSEHEDDPYGLAEAKARFKLSNPNHAGEPILDEEIYCLLGRIRLNHPESAAQIERLQANSIMLRNSTIPMLLGALIFLVEAFTDPVWVRSIAIALLLGLGAILATNQSNRFARWSVTETLDMAVWIQTKPDSRG
jgi:hypothetical protein